MNKIKYAASQCTLVVFILFLGVSSVLGSNISTVMDATIENRIMSLGISVDAKYSSEVKKRVHQYTVKQRKTTEILIGRSNLYFSTYDQILREKGLPLDLKYLSVIESGLKPAATSRIGAAGLWQFMRPTGRMMGLKITRNIDERRDVEKSTRAAADYLLRLYNQFDDWTLAIAAYNCGPGNMRKAIRKSGGKRNYWQVQKYLPKETREYVPKYIAMCYVMNYYYDHDLSPKLPAEELLNTSSAQVFESLNLNNLSKELKIDLKTMRTLNPSFIRNFIPHSEDGKYKLVLPTPEMRIVASKYNVLAALPKLKEKEKTAIEKIDAPRLLLNMPQALNISNNKDEEPLMLRSMYVHPVRYGEEEEDMLLDRPKSYKINDNKGILYYHSLIKNLRGA